MTDAPIYTPIDRTLRLDTRLFFGVGQVAEGLKNFSISYFALFYYNHVLGLSGSLTGLALAIALVVDALTDPMMGSLSDNFRSRWGRRHPFMVGGALPLALAFFALLVAADTTPSAEVCERGSWEAVRAALSAHPDARPISPSTPELDGFVVDGAVPDADVDALGRAVKRLNTGAERDAESAGTTAPRSEYAEVNAMLRLLHLERVRRARAREENGNGNGNV